MGAKPTNSSSWLGLFKGSPTGTGKIKYFFRAEMERKKQAKNSKPHIKKPLNAFMLYMKEQRAKVVSECTLKESAAINQILGRKVSHSYSTTNPPPFHEMEFFYRGGDLERNYC